MWVFGGGNSGSGSPASAPVLYQNDPVLTPCGSGIVHDWTPGQVSICVKFAADKFRWMDRSLVIHKTGK